MSELDEYRALAQQELRANAALVFRHSGTFRHVQNGRERLYPCEFSVKDPQKVGRTALAAAEAFARSLEGVSYTDVRLLSVHPDHKRPPKGAVLVEPWDGGRLEVMEWSQPSDFSGQAVGTCVLRR